MTSTRRAITQRAATHVFHRVVISVTHATSHPTANTIRAPTRTTTPIEVSVRGRCNTYSRACRQVDDGATPLTAIAVTGQPRHDTSAPISQPIQTADLLTDRAPTSDHYTRPCLDHRHGQYLDPYLTEGMSHIPTPPPNPQPRSEPRSRHASVSSAGSCRISNQTRANRYMP